MDVDNVVLCRPCAIRGIHEPAVNYLETPSAPFWPLCEKHSNVVRRSLYGDPEPISVYPPEPGSVLKAIHKENK